MSDQPDDQAAEPIETTPPAGPEPTREPAPARGRFHPCKPNPAWPEEIRYLIRFYRPVRGEKLPACPACGAKRAKRWTMLCPFRAYRFATFTIEPAGTFEPLTLVCADHPLNPTEPIMEAL